MEDQISIQDTDENPIKLKKKKEKRMRDKSRGGCESNPKGARRFKKQEKRRRDAMKTLKSTLCFNEGSPLIVDVKLFVFGVCIYTLIPPHCWDSTVRHHSIAP